ncbi:hypothetical protein GCM10011586_08720 [Silvibacterium dinghuense]|nr:hypothetical protein GCM10011586_08720 [Silvibacterium dinghuense]
MLTGASGSGKTAIAQKFERLYPQVRVFRFDTIGVPSAEIMATYGPGHQPGGSWQRAMTLEWFARIEPHIRQGKQVLFEGQMRLAFIREAMAEQNLRPHIVLIDCDDTTRAARLTGERWQPELATAQMMGWARYLREEAEALGAEIFDTSRLSLEASTAHVAALFGLISR